MMRGHVSPEAPASKVSAMRFLPGGTRTTSLQPLGGGAPDEPEAVGRDTGVEGCDCSPGVLVTLGRGVRVGPVALGVVTRGEEMGGPSSGSVVSVGVGSEAVVGSAVSVCVGAGASSVGDGGATVGVFSTWVGVLTLSLATAGVPAGGA